MNNIEYFIRVRKSRNLLDCIKYDVDNWELTKVRDYIMDLGESTFIPFETTTIENNPKSYRIIISRIKREANKYDYRVIMTNNKIMTKGQIVNFYNQRGAIERNFDDLKNNFNWGRLPFSLLNENTTFLIISAIVSIIYRYIIKKFNPKVDFIKHNFRLKKLYFPFYYSKLNLGKKTI